MPASGLWVGDEAPKRLGLSPGSGRRVDGRAKFFSRSPWLACKMITNLEQSACGSSLLVAIVGSSQRIVLI